MRWGERIVLAVGAALALALLVPVTASAAVGTPLAFRLHASNGFAVHVIAVAPHDGRPGGLVVALSRRDEAVDYATPAQVSEAGIEADLGAVGRIDVHFVPDGTVVREGSRCDKRKLEFEGGFYEGQIEIRGEEGFAAVDATRARPEVGFLLSLLCSMEVSEGTGGHSPGARLTSSRRVGGGQVEFVGRINSPSRPSRFEASISETRGPLRVLRSVQAVGPPAAFRFDVPAGRATLGPPLPFAGVARFERSRSGSGHLLGNLAVDFPGNSDVRLAGSDTRAGLERYVDNPSHPFRPAASVSAWPSTKPWPTASARSSPLAPS